MGNRYNCIVSLQIIYVFISIGFQKILILIFILYINYDTSKYRDNITYNNKIYSFIYPSQYPEID